MKANSQKQRCLALRFVSFLNALSAIVRAKFLYELIIFKSSICSDAGFQPS